MFYKFKIEAVFEKIETTKIRKRANEMGIKFDKYSFEEFYVVVLMKYTDHCKTLGTANMDIYLKL